MKIAIGPVFDEYGGVSRHIFGILRFSSHDVSVIPSKLTRLFLTRCRFAQPYYKKLMERIRLSHYDVVHSHADPWFEKLCRLSKSDTCKWVHTYHSLFFEQDYKGGLKEWQKLSNRSAIEIGSKADLRISASKWMQEHLLEKYSIQTTVVENGIDLDTCDKANRVRFERKFGLRNFVLFVGGIREVKNPVRFVQLAEQIPGEQFVMIGERLDRLNMTKEYGISLPSNVVLMGNMRHRDVLDAMSACKVYVVTSLRETTPITLLEAMALRKTVVVPSHTGCLEVVTTEEYGFLYDQTSLDELVEKTKLAFASTHHGEKARQRILQRYDWKLLVRKIDALYET